MSERLVPDQVARKEFPLAFRGFDQHEVRAFLGEAASELARWIERVEELEARVDALESAPVAEPDESMMEAALGREATRVLHVAREAAGEIRANATAEVEAARAAASEEMAAMRAALEAEVTSRREEAERRQAAVLDSARRDAEGIVADATAARDRIATEVARLRAARDRMAAAFEDVRRALDVPAEPTTAEAPPAPAPVEVVQPEPAPEPEREPDAEEPAVELAVVPTPAPEPEPAPPADERRSSSLRLVRPTEGTPVAPPVADDVEGVRIIRPESESESDSEPEPEPEHEPEPEAEVVVEEPPAPEPVVEPELEVVADAAAPEPEAAPVVEDLFSRLRAERAEKVAHAETVLADGASLEPEPEPDPAPAPPEEPGADALEPDLAVLAARDEVVGDAERRLVKSLKRTLADEQNEVLDALRRLKGRPTLEALLPDQAVHDARYEAVLSTASTDAAAAGGDAGGGGEVARDFGRTVVVELRARLDRAIDDAGGDLETLAEAISATYREWKSARAEPLARDVITAGYAAGAYGAAEGPLRWVVDPAEGGCPDCDDNVLAGATEKGTAFPTGQLHPPAHAGCRCLAVPAS